MSSISNMQTIPAPGTIKYQGVETAWADTAIEGNILKPWPNLHFL